LFGICRHAIECVIDSAINEGWRVVAVVHTHTGVVPFLFQICCSVELFDDIFLDHSCKEL